MKSLISKLGFAALFGLGVLGYAGNSKANTLAENYGLEKMLSESIVEQNVDASSNLNNYLLNSPNNGLVKKTTHKPYTPEEMIWDKPTLIISENVKHNFGSKILDKIYNGTASFNVNYKGILDDIKGGDSWGFWDKFFWVPGFGVQVLHQNFYIGLDNLNPNINDKPPEATKTHITWHIDSGWRYYLKDNLYCGLLFRHKSSDRPIEKTVNIKEFMAENPGAGIIEPNLNIVSYDCAYKSPPSKFTYQLRGLLNVWQALPHPMGIIKSHFDGRLREDYPNLIATDGRVEYELSPGVRLYTDFKVEFPKDFPANEPQTNISFNLGLGMFSLFYEMSRGRPDKWIIPNGFTTDSNNDKFGIKIKGF